MWEKYGPPGAQGAVSHGTQTRVAGMKGALLQLVLEQAVLLWDEQLQSWVVGRVTVATENVS